MCRFCKGPDAWTVGGEPNPIAYVRWRQWLLKQTPRGYVLGPPYRLPPGWDKGSRRELYSIHKEKTDVPVLPTAQGQNPSEAT